MENEFLQKIEDKIDSKVRELVVMSHQQNAKTTSNIMGDMQELKRDVANIKKEVHEMVQAHNEAHAGLNTTIKEMGKDLNASIVDLGRKISDGDIKNTQIDGELKLVYLKIDENKSKIDGLTAKLWWAAAIVLGAVITNIVIGIMK